jgi:hypothetical protein
MFTAGQLVAHLVGDYVLQSDWVAAKKTERNPTGWSAGLVHAVFYTLPFVIITRNWRALVFIFIAHFIIDHWRLARHVTWLKNWMAPKWLPYIIVVGVGGEEAELDVTMTGGKSPGSEVEIPLGTTFTNADGKCFTVIQNKAHNLPWRKCSKTGYPDDKPAWLAVWLLILTDNTMHLILNGLALYLWR